MASTQTYTTNLKLILEDSLSTNARYNLTRIDSLGDAFNITTGKNLEIKAKVKIILRPNAAESGGTGAGGNLDISTAAQILDSFNVYSDVSNFMGSIKSEGISLKSGLYEIGLTAPSLTSSYSLTLPLDNGATGQVLATDGSGNLSWTSPSSVPSYSTSWTSGDGLVKTVNHGLSSSNPVITLKENSSGQQIFISEILVTSPNQVSLTSSETPGAGGWTIYVF